MLCDVPVVDRAVRVASREDLDVAVGILGEGLAIVDVVLVERLLGHHHRVRVHVHVVEEHSTAAECIVANPSILCLAEARVDAAAKLPAAITLSLEEQRRVVEATADVSVLADEHTSQDWVASVHSALC